MDTFYSHGFAAIAIVCLVVLFLSAFKRKSNTILMFIQRGIVGFLAIVGLNRLFVSLTIELFVGVNVWTLLTCAILGIPGVCMLFCIGLF
ncbi:MAG: hypothetical protein E7289_07995 [Lachnospiraceae bacterium]|nr:hypothetical protein [Lachnospiraceae bacterium]